MKEIRLSAKQLYALQCVNMEHRVGGLHHQNTINSLERLGLITMRRGLLITDFGRDVVKKEGYRHYLTKI